MKIGFISLGCSKNLVDTEMMIKFYQEKGMEIVQNPIEAEMIESWVKNNIDESLIKEVVKVSKSLKS